MEKMETRTENQNKHSSRFLCLNHVMTYMFVLRGSIILERKFDVENVPKLNVIFLSWFIFATQPLPLLFINVPPSVSNSNYI